MGVGNRAEQLGVTTGETLAEMLSRLKTHAQETEAKPLPKGAGVGRWAFGILPLQFLAIIERLEELEAENRRLRENRAAIE